MIQNNFSKKPIVSRSSIDQYMMGSKSALRKSFVTYLCLNLISFAIVFTCFKFIPPLRSSWKISLNKKLMLSACTTITFLHIHLFIKRIYHMLSGSWARSASREAHDAFLCRRFQYANEMQNNSHQKVSRIRLLSHYRFYARVPLRLAKEFVKLATLPLRISLVYLSIPLGIIHPHWGLRCINKLEHFWHPLKPSSRVSTKFCQYASKVILDKEKETFSSTLYSLIYKILPSSGKSLSIPIVQKRKLNAKKIISAHQNNIKKIEKLLLIMIYHREKIKKTKFSKENLKEHYHDITDLIKRYPRQNLELNKIRREISCKLKQENSDLIPPDNIKKEISIPRLPIGKTDKRTFEYQLEIYSHDLYPKQTNMNLSPIPPVTKYQLASIEYPFDIEEMINNEQHKANFLVQPKTLKTLLSASAKYLQKLKILRKKNSSYFFKNKKTSQKLSEEVNTMYNKLSKINKLLTQAIIGIEEIIEKADEKVLPDSI